MHVRQERKRLRERIEAHGLRLFDVEEKVGMGKTQLSKRLSGALVLTEEQVKQLHLAIDRMTK